MLGSSYKLISSYNDLRRQAAQNSPDFANNLCEFLSEEFELYSALLFKVAPDSALRVTGRSSFVKKIYRDDVEFRCAKCSNLNGRNPKLIFHSDTECGIHSTDFMLYEGCISFDASDNQTYLLKIAQKSPFNQSDIDIIPNIIQFIGSLISVWGGDVTVKGEPSFVKMMANISNELRTPANNILGFSSLLYDDKLNQVQTEYTSSIKENSQKLLGLINDLIDISKLEAGLIEESVGSIKLRAFIEENIKNFQEKISGLPFSFEMIVEQGVPDSLKIDSQKLKSIFQNLLSFLVASTQSGQITLSVNYREKDKITFKFSNDSLSIPLTEQRDIFTVNNYNSELKPLKNVISTVLGLNVVKRLVKLLGGDIEIQSSPGKGTSFTFWVKTEALSPLEATIGALPKLDGTRNKVLVIEDDYATAKLLSNYLNKWGYEPSIINSGLRALQLLEKEQYLAIITDVVLPDINGLELLKKIRENKTTKHTPIIVCSVEAEQQKAFMMGAVEYFIKPISYRDLVEVLTSYKLKKDSNVLCVDDDPATLNLVKEAIESVGFNPIAEIQSSRVMNRIQNIELDLAIVDLDMPEVNGFELIKMIKSEVRFASLPIIIYTGKENFEEDLAKIDGLFSELLSKRSTRIEDLAETISKMVNRYEEPTPPEEAAKVKDVPKILLVEDYKHSQIIVTRLLKKNGFTSVVVVENGAEAVDQVKMQQFDLILMDMQMPVMNGFEATERIRQMPEYKNIPIIALTAFAMKGDKEKCLDAGATDYIPKPIDSHDFIEKVKYYTSA